MKGNSDKFQAKSIGRTTNHETVSFNLDNNNINVKSTLQLLGGTIDVQLIFYVGVHVSTICKTASHKLNAMKCIGKMCVN